MTYSADFRTQVIKSVDFYIFVSGFNKNITFLNTHIQRTFDQACHTLNPM